MKIFNRQGRALLIATVIMAVLVGCGGDNGGTTPSHTHTWGDWVVTTPATCDAHGVETRICTQDNRHSEIRATTAISPNTVVKGTLIDGRDGKEYKTITICRQTWIVENLNYAATSGTWCFGDFGDGTHSSFSKCDKYGRLYDWNTARTVCPSGYRLPIEDDWNKLIEMTGGTANGWGANALKLKSKSGWRYDDYNTDEYGFSALPGGFGSVGGYLDQGGAFWWTSTETEENIDRVYVAIIDGGDFGRANGFTPDMVLVWTIPKDYKLSVRCIADNSLIHTHTWGEWIVTTQATCDAPGVETRTCKIDNTHKETRVVAQLTGAGCTTTHVHDWGEWVVTTQATCDAPGVETRTCKINNTHKETRAIAQLIGVGCNSTNGNDSYESVVIGGKKWMKKNLNIEMADSWCYKNSPDNCAKYGRLYTWAAAKTACPNGWHLPTQDEWDQLAESVGGTKSFYAGTKYYWLGAGKKLKSTTGWGDGYNGTDSHGFSALPGGNRNSDGSFINAGDYGDWWAATEDTSGYVPYRTMGYDDDDVFEFYRDKTGGSSVRCVQN